MAAGAFPPRPGYGCPPLLPEASAGAIIRPQPGASPLLLPRPRRLVRPVRGRFCFLSKRDSHKDRPPTRTYNAEVSFSLHPAAKERSAGLPSPLRMPATKGTKSQQLYILLFMLVKGNCIGDQMILSAIL
jgi:hypothetical protein